jgi:hypothetical protein
LTCCTPARDEGFWTGVLGARRIGGPQADVREAGNARIDAGNVARAAVIWRHDELDAVAGQIVKMDERVHPSLLALVGGAACDPHAALLEKRGGMVEFRRIAQLEAGGVIGGIAIEIDQRMVAGVAAEVVRAAFLAGPFETHHLAREAAGADQVAGTEADVADVEQVDHGASVGRTDRVSALYLSRLPWLIRTTAATIGQTW